MLKSTYPKHEITFGKMFRLSFRQHFQTLVYAFVCVFLLFSLLLISKTPQALVLVNSLPPFVLLIVKLVFWLVFFFFFSVALFATHHSLNDETLSYFAALRGFIKKLPKVVLTSILYLGGALILTNFFHLLFLLILHFDKHVDHIAQIVLAFFTIAAVGVFVCMFFFSYPLSVIEREQIKKCFYRSAVLSDKNKTGILLELFFITMPYSILLGGGNSIPFLVKHHLVPAYDFFVLCLFVPMFINMLLLLINDSKRQLILEQ